MEKIWSHRFKMICHGILINDHEPLHSQRVSNNSRVLVISLPSDPNQHIVSHFFYKLPHSKVNLVF